MHWYSVTLTSQSVWRLGSTQISKSNCTYLPRNKLSICDNYLQTVRADKPWYTTELSQEKRLRRKYQQRYKQSKLTVDKMQLQEQRNEYNALLNSTKKDYIKNKIENAESSKDLYKISDKLLNREQKTILPSHDCAQSLANTIVYHFNEKIELIRNNLETSLDSSMDQVPDSVSIFCCVPFEQFMVAFLTPLIKKIILDCEFVRTTGLCLIYLSFQSLWIVLFLFN